MFENWFKPNELQMGVFERQFAEENGTWVYRRYGKGPAYRVDVGQRDAMISKYVSDHRKRGGLLSALIMLTMTAMLILVVASGIEPDETTLWWIMGPVWVLLITWFVLANQRAVTAPERELSRTAPIASALTADETRAKFLAQTSYGTFAMAPLAGLAMVLVAAKNIDVWTGWGRLVWLVPVGFACLGALQASRKYRLGQHRP